MTLNHSADGPNAGQKPVFMACDEVLLAVGQQNAFPWIEKDIGLSFDQYDRPQVDEITYQSNIEKIFFGGDAAFGPRNVITAVAHGHGSLFGVTCLCVFYSGW